MKNIAKLIKSIDMLTKQLEKVKEQLTTQQGSAVVEKAVKGAQEKR